MEKTTKGTIYVLIAMVLFSTGGFFIKLINANAYTITFGRAFIAGLIFLPLIQWKKFRFSKNYLGLVIGYCYLCIMFVLTTKITTAANAIILQCTAPLWLYLYYVIRGKKITGRELIPRLLILVGIIVILSASAGGNLWGDLLALSNGVAYAVVQHFMDKEYPVSDNSIVGFNNIILCLVILALFPTQLDFTGLSMAGWLGLIFLGIFQLGLSYLIFFKGVRMISALKASMVSLLEPILNPIFVFFFVGEMPSVYSLIGFGIILFGIALTMIPAKTGRQIEEY
ncbi:DMT family transporter [Acetobacterium sp.]|jgi:drug/metabolite transporter (DMT)-like permease|uniref:DMT family transporter n=1 Tax=Acetobacterium sp. TaxID=1872094 RepID=UPI000CAADA1C|nr:EamA family transporter [Acetobacterium sp.]MDO9493675.1 EamA family transporter [Acetobacterium sp.]PKM71473.1 MAG: transporter [Firmicutes bacterium HGW-Firmicutes-17]